MLAFLGCDKLITPDCIRAMYKIPVATKSHPENSLGMFQEDNYFHSKDLDLFFENQTTNIPRGTRPLVAMIANTEGDGSSSKFGLESALDLQVAYPIVYPQTITIYQTNDHMVSQNLSQGFLDAFLNAIDGVSSVRLNLFHHQILIITQSYCTNCASEQCGNGKRTDPDSLSESDNRLLCGIHKPANVISISYGGPEQNFPVPYQRRQCNEYVIPFEPYRSPLTARSGIPDTNSKQVYEARSPGCIGPVCLGRPWRRRPRRLPRPQGGHI